MQLPWRSLHKPGRSHASSWPPTATQWLLSALASCLLVQCFLPWPTGPSGRLQAIFALSVHGLAQGKFWQPLSYLFLSSKPWLDFAALLGLYLAGSNLELIIGRRHLLQVYFLAGIFGGLGQLAYNACTQRAPDLVLVGPTAAVMGVFLALTSVMPNLELAPLLGFPLPFWLKIKHCALGVMIACAVLPLLDQRAHFAQAQATRCLIGSLTGCVYMWQLGFGRRSRARADVPEREPALQIPVFSQGAQTAVGEEPATLLPRFTERERRMTPRQYISEQIDPILDKISLHGIGCLTAEEHRLLEKARDKISQAEERRRG